MKLPVPKSVDQNYLGFSIQNVEDLVNLIEFAAKENGEEWRGKILADEVYNLLTKESQKYDIQDLLGQVIRSFFINSINECDTHEGDIASIKSLLDNFIKTAEWTIKPVGLPQSEKKLLQETMKNIDVLDSDLKIFVATLKQCRQRIDELEKLVDQMNNFLNDK